MTFKEFLKQLLKVVQDILFPPTKRSQRLRRLGQDVTEGVERVNLDDRKRSAVFAYSDDTVQTVLKAHKYDNDHRARQLMAQVLADHILGIAEDKRLFAKHIYITPIPMHHEKAARQINHNQKLAKEICDQNSGFRLADVLQKVRKTKPQTELSRKKRLTNLTEAFRADPSHNLEEKIVFVIDDATTTGATLKEARRAIRTACDPEHLHCLAFAH